MNCKNCGAELGEGAVFCGNCGMKVEAEQPVCEVPVQEENYQETYNEYQEQGSYVPPVMPEFSAEPVSSAEKPNTVLWIVLSAIHIFLCFPLTGIVSLIFSIIAHLSADKGDFADALKKLKFAKISFWIGFSIGLLLVLILAFVFVLGIATGLLEESMYY